MVNVRKYSIHSAHMGKRDVPVGPPHFCPEVTTVPLIGNLFLPSVLCLVGTLGWGTSRKMNQTKQGRGGVGRSWELLEEMVDF